MMERRRNVVSELEDLVMFGVYIVILYIVALANKDHLLNQSKMMLEDVMAGVHTRSMSFADTESSQNIYDYINQTLIPSLQPIKWYGNYVVSDPGLMIDMSNKYIGVARLRQVRVKNKTCRPPDLLHFLNLTCRPEITFYLVESRTFGYGWGKFSEFLEFDRLRNIWKYAREHETGTFATAGEFATYTGGGYLANLGRTLYNSYANVRKFFQKFWIDRRTRSIFIEFLTYNANYNVFNSVRLLFEQSASGYTYKSINVDAVRMLFVQNEVEKITVIFFFMFVAWVGMLFFKQSLGVIKKFKSFYKDVWFIVDFIIISMSISTIGLFILRMKMIGVYLQKLETIKHNEFLNYFYLFYLEDFLKILAAVLVCIATIRLWKFLRFGLMFRVLERTLAVSIPSLMSFTMVYLVLLLTFAQPLVFLCGNHLEKIDTIVKMLRLMFTMAMNAGEMEMQNYLHFRSSVFLIVSYGFMAKITFLIFIIIIMTAYSDAQMEFSVDVSNYTVKHYVQEKVKYFPKFVKYKYRRRRLKGGEEDKTKIEAKSDKFVYSNCFSIETDRMTAMFYITKCIFRNIRTVKVSDMTDWDIELMSGVSRQYLVKNRHENVEIFFKGRIKGKKIALIDEKRVLKVAEAVNLILQEKDEKRMKTKTSQSKAMFEYEKCVKIIRKNQNSLKECDLSLGLLLEKVTIVELELAKLI